MIDPIPLEEVRARLTARSGRVVAGDHWRHAAVAAVFRAGPRGAELLFIQRAHHDHDPWSGQIGFPGGREEESDPTLRDTAVRETREELGLELEADPAVDAIGALDQLQARARQKILPMAITPFAFVHRGGARPDLTPNEEVESAFWTPLMDLMDPARRTWFDAHRAELPLQFPALDLGPGRVLWGLTHYMTVEILHRLGRVPDVDRATNPRTRPS